MSVKVMMIGLIALFTSVFAGIAGLMGLVPQMAYIILAIVLTAVPAIALMIVCMQLNGVMGPFLTAKQKGLLLPIVITPAGNMSLAYGGKEEEGFIMSKKGYVNIPKESIYSWPNGVKGGVGYSTIGTVIPPKIIEACSVMKENGVEDANGMRLLRKWELEHKNAEGRPTEIALNTGAVFDTPKEQLPDYPEEPVPKKKKGLLGRIKKNKNDASAVQPVPIETKFITQEEGNRFANAYSSIPIGERSKMAADIEGTPVSWNVAWNEIKQNTEFGKKIISSMIKSKTI